MKNLLLPIYIILGVIISIELTESAIAESDDRILFFACAFFSIVITLLITKKLFRKLRIF